jgi:hypothetical protein
MIPESLIYSGNRNALVVYGVLDRIAATSGNLFASLTLICERSGLSRRTVQTARDWLISYGYIELVSRGNGRNASDYHLPFRSRDAENNIPGGVDSTPQGSTDFTSNESPKGESPKGERTPPIPTPPPIIIPPSLEPFHELMQAAYSYRPTSDELTDLAQVAEKYGIDPRQQALVFLDWQREPANRKKRASFRRLRRWFENVEVLPDKRAPVATPGTFARYGAR